MNLKFLPKNKFILSNIIKKGSISIDGINLTILKNIKQYFSVSIISQTLENSNFLDKKKKIFLYWWKRYFNKK